jgi:hypothetical protein
MCTYSLTDNSIGVDRMKCLDMTTDCSSKERSLFFFKRYQEIVYFEGGGKKDRITLRDQVEHGSDLIAYRHLKQGDFYFEREIGRIKSGDKMEHPLSSSYRTKNLNFNSAGIRYSCLPFNKCLWVNWVLFNNKEM